MDILRPKVFNVIGSGGQPDVVEHQRLIVTEETPAQIKEMGAIGKLVENCTDCQKPTRYWVNDGEYPLCPTCAGKRP